MDDNFTFKGKQFHSWTPHHTKFSSIEVNYDFYALIHKFPIKAEDYFHHEDLELFKVCRRQLNCSILADGRYAWIWRHTQQGKLNCSLSSASTSSWQSKV